MSRRGNETFPLDTLKSIELKLREEEFHYYADTIARVINFVEFNVANTVYDFNESSIIFDALDELADDYGLTTEEILSDMSHYLRPEVLDEYEYWRSEE